MSTILDLLIEYPHLLSITKLLIQKTQSPIESPEARKEAELTLKEIRLLATAARRVQYETRRNAS